MGILYARHADHDATYSVHNSEEEMRGEMRVVTGLLGRGRLLGKPSENLVVELGEILIARCEDWEGSD